MRFCRTRTARDSSNVNDPLGLVMVVLAAFALLWAVDSGQYDGDVESQGLIVLEDAREEQVPP